MTTRGERGLRAKLQKGNLKEATLFVLIKKYSFYLMFIIVWSACVSMDIMYAWCSWSSEEDVGSPGTEVLGGCKCWERKQGLLPLSHFSSHCSKHF